jgi:5-methylcytosine-specific restriction protein B
MAKYFSEDYINLLAEYGSVAQKKAGDEVVSRYKKMRVEFEDFTSELAKMNGLTAAKRGIGMWQASGYLAKYLWNRYKIPSCSETNLVIYFSLHGIQKSLFVSIGFDDSKKTETEMSFESDLYHYLAQELSIINVNDFTLKVDEDNFDRYLTYNHKLTDIHDLSNFNDLLSKVKDVYISTLERFYYSDQSKNSAIKSNDEKSYDKNIILYGPPGTGKTYHTINKALQIIDPGFYGEHSQDRKALNDKFRELQSSGQIEMVTFHQSYGYEEFVEGIKAIPPSTDGNNSEEMIYDVESGIFNKLCFAADDISADIKSKKVSFDISEDTQFFKVSLSGADANPIKSDCYKNGHIRFSYEYKYNQDLSNTNIKLNSPLNILKNVMQVGDIVVSISKSIGQGQSCMINNIGVIESDYIYLTDREDHRHARKVNWLFDKPKEINFLDINNNTSFSNPALHSINPNKKLLLNVLKENNVDVNIESDNTVKNYVLIIDEINRGNISKIFGELITLIEPNKRLGCKEQLKIKLPYSNTEFGVPSNLYIIGTMNTADKSIATIDTALRRRFVFEEMMPNYDLDEVSEDCDGVNLHELLKAINQRIEYLYDRDHMIGHAYFMGIDSIVKLNEVFKNKIIPLLQEYFYEDWEKIQMVLGDHPEQKPNGDSFSSDSIDLRFIFDTSKDEKNLFGFNHDDIEENKKLYVVNPGILDLRAGAYTKIYEKT